MEGHSKPRTCLTKSQKCCKRFWESTQVSDWEYELKEFQKENSSMKLYIKEKPYTSNTRPLIFYGKILHRCRILLPLKSVFLSGNF